MLMQEERELVVEYGRKMSTDRLSTGTSGNISVCNAEKGLMAISPSGMDYFSTTPEDVVITDLEANIVDGVRLQSSIEGRPCRCPGPFLKPEGCHDPPRYVTEKDCGSAFWGFHFGKIGL